MAFVGLGCAWWGGPAVLRPPKPSGGPVRVVRAWELGYVLMGPCMAVRMVTRLVGKEPARLMAMTYWAVEPFLVCSITAAYVSRRRARRRAGAATVGRHK
ncbi:hypothetical protein OHB56_07715 [Streptomyces sp. NBC_01635]|uniref:hypothetical protein n=1 Tax=Streptomyces sp. NBC_01635 TaxID=2975904 RepID=UPI00386ED49B|nr:hypothetical protein OHB56_07715 [Streptomyces sp. NBC_01635]